MVIPMDTTLTTQDPSGPMTRARARAIQSEVNSLLVELPFDPLETWLLPQMEMLCVLRYQESNQGEVTMQDEHQEHGEGFSQHRDRGTTGPPVLPVNYWSTFCNQTGTRPVSPRFIPVTAKRPVLPPKPPVLPLIPSENTSKKQHLSP